MHGISPVSFTLEHLKLNKLGIALSLLRSDLLLHELLLALGEFEGLAHPVQLACAVVMIAAVVIVSKAILILRRLDHDEHVDIELCLLLLLLLDLFDHLSVFLCGCHIAFN